MSTILEFSHREFRVVVGTVFGVRPVLPVIVTEQGVLGQFVEYMRLNRFKSRSWQDSATFALRLLLEFMEVNKDRYVKPRALFLAFTEALSVGTIEDFSDPSGLWWNPRQPKETSKLIDHITQFSDWLSVINEDAELQLNPWKLASRHEERLNWAARLHKKDNAFLSHLHKGAPSQSKLSRLIRPRELPTERQTPFKTFPDPKIEVLLAEGFRRWGQYECEQSDLRNTLITMLMHYGGLRLSEALSLWCGDVSIESGEVVVRVYHPEHGMAPTGKNNRATYLQNQYGLQPRNRLVRADPLFLGGKNCLITDPHRNCFEVFFYPHDAGEKFARMWRDYHLMQRVKPKAGEGHPYAFTNKYGQPYSHRMFRNAHKLAVERIGLECGKLLGTTPHGHRHAYGQRLAGDGANAMLIKNAMHHASINSSQAYTQPSSIQIRQALSDLDARLSSLHVDDKLGQVSRGNIDGSKKG